MTTDKLPRLITIDICVSCHDLLSDDDKSCFCTKEDWDTQEIKEYCESNSVHAHLDEIKRLLIGVTLMQDDKERKQVLAWLITQLERTDR